jgi:hypothetical protein
MCLFGDKKACSPKCYLLQLWLSFLLDPKTQLAIGGFYAAFRVLVLVPNFILPKLAQTKYKPITNMLGI